MTAYYDDEKWVELYRLAMLEFQTSLLAGRISDARTHITARVEKLRELPGLHAEERQAIEDALSGLMALEREEIRHAKGEQRKLAEEALEKLRLIEPKIARLKSDGSDSPSDS